jgi:hypothetical protein
MSELVYSATNHFAYNIHEGEALMGQVSRIICIILPRSFVIAGFSDRGDLLMIRYKEYDKTLTTWILDFYEHHFIDEPLLSRPDMVVATFIGTDKYLLAPAALYEESAAERWMRSLFFIEDNDIITSHPLREDKAQYVYALPGTIRGLVNRYFPNSKLLPLPVYQFHHHHKADNAIHCCITPEQAYATFYKDKQLAWHQVFSYQTGEDIAYQLKLVCKEHKIDSDDVDLEYALVHSGLTDVLTTFSSYFKNVRQSDTGMMSTNREWMPAISLLQRLYICAL